MTPERVLTLPLVPTSVADAHGHPRFGTYRGELDEVVLERLMGPYALPAPLRWLKHKKWTYATVAAPEVVAVFAIADFTYTSNAFVSIVDLGTGRVVFDDSFLGLPGTRVHVGPRPGPGACASFKRPGVSFRIERHAGTQRYDINLDIRPLNPFADRIRWEGSLTAQGAPDALTVIAPVPEDGLVNVTQKRAAMLSLGTLRVGRRTYGLDGGVGGVDYTSGLLARHTRWRWAMGNGRLADGTAFGFNLVEGINDQSERCNENALWVGGDLYPLARARFGFRKEDPLSPWTVQTVDGAVTLRFHPLHVHKESRDYKLVRSNFVQPLGLFSGSIRAGGRTLEVNDVGGVTEDQDIVW